MNRFSFRLLFGLGAVACAGAMAFALYLQYFGGLDPCPLCVVQRVAMIATGVVFLAGVLHAPGAGAARWAYAGAAALTAGFGAGVAARHVWLQNLPPDQVPACGPTIEYLLDMLPLTEVLMTLLRGDGNCALIDAQFLGISLPGWTLIAFAGLTLYALAAPLAARTGISRMEIP